MTLELSSGSWEGRPGRELEALWGVPRLHLFSRVGSTNDVARRLGDAGAATGTVVLADEQATGRGRIGRAWSSPPGLGVWLSMVLRADAVGDATLLPLRLGARIALRLDPLVRTHAVSLKWPNDLLIGGKKLGGILCEGFWAEGRLAFVVVGVGVNVLHDEGDFPPELRAGATSIHLESDSRPSREQAAGAILSGALEVAAHPGVVLTSDEQRILEARDALRGREVHVTGTTPKDTILSGVALGISPAGELLLRTREGALRRVRSGTVRPATDRDHFVTSLA